MNGFCARHPGAPVQLYMLGADDNPDVQEACHACLNEFAAADAGFFDFPPEAGSAEERETSAAARPAEALAQTDGPASTPLGHFATTEELHASLRRGLDQAAAGQVVDLGSFAEYLDEEEDAA